MRSTSKNNKFNVIDKIFLGSAIFMVIVIFVAIFMSFRFLSGKLFGTFSSVSDGQAKLEFDIEGYNKLGI